MNQRSLQDRIIHFVVGVVAGAVALVFFAAIGLPAIFQICWGAAVAIAVWWRFEPDDDAVDAVAGGEAR